MAKETKADALDKVFDQIDPEVVLAGALGAVASMGGIIPPFTRLLMMFGGASGNQQDLSSDLKQASTNLGVGALFNPIMAPAALWTGIASLVVGANEQTDPEKQKAAIAQAALAASGAMEGMLMMSIMKHPEILTTIIRQPAEMLKGIGEIVPG